MENVEKMKSLISTMQKESTAYYEGDAPIVSDREYDAQFDQLLSLEEVTGIRFPNSPTQKVSGGCVDYLEKVIHSKPMLSAAKTKDVSRILTFADLAGKLKENRIVVSWKLDGLTIVIRYIGGHLAQAITRGSGSEGEDVTHNIFSFLDVPHQIPYTGDLEVRGEGVISWKNFKAINDTLPLDEQYSHPRNLAAGSTRQLDSAEAAKRFLEFKAFELVSPSGKPLHEELDFLADNGFSVVEHEVVTVDALEEAIKAFTAKADSYAHPVDGLIAEYNDRAFGKRLGATGHHESCRIAFKWEDKLSETVFRDVDYQTTRTGMVSMTAVFDPVVIDGATVSRATLHNLSIFESLKLGVGDKISVYKANKIIPAIAENLTKSSSMHVATTCPCCGQSLVVREGKKVHDGLPVKFLMCPNETCPAREIRRFVHFVSKPAANIVGLSVAGLTQLLGGGYVKTFADLYKLSRHESKIVALDGMGRRSFEKLQEAVEKSRTMTMASFLVGFGIPVVGKTISAILMDYYDGDVMALLKAVDDGFDFSSIPNVGAVASANLSTYVLNPVNRSELMHLLEEVEIAAPTKLTVPADSIFAGKIVVATGSFEHFTRSSINEKLVTLGAKAGSSVSKKTDYVIVGTDAGSKHSKALELGIKILDEGEFLSMIGDN